jgi:hypothetical protein
MRPEPLSALDAVPTLTSANAATSVRVALVLVVARPGSATRNPLLPLFRGVIVPSFPHVGQL